MYNPNEYNMLQSIHIKKIPISCIKTIEFVLPEKIIRIEGMQNYSKIIVDGDCDITSNSNIGFFKSYLQKHNFIVCHKSHIINPDFLVRYHKDGYVELEDGVLIPLARRRKKEFINLVIRESEITSDSYIL